MIYLVTFLDKNGKSDVYEGGDIHGIYCYLEMIGAPTTLTTSGHRSHHFGPSYSSNNDSATLQPVIAALRMRQKIFVNAVEELDTNLMHVSSMVQNYSRQVLGERWNNSMHYIMMNQNNQQENGTANLRQLTSNPSPLLPETILWFHLSWENWIIMP